MRVGHQPVPARGMPDAFRPLYEGLIDGVEPADATGDLAREAVALVEAISTDAAAPLVLMGQAQRLRQHFLALRLGPPPLPAFAGLLRPAWIMEDLATEMQAAQETQRIDKGPAIIVILHLCTVEIPRKIYFSWKYFLIKLKILKIIRCGEHRMAEQAQQERTEFEKTIRWEDVFS